MKQKITLFYLVGLLFLNQSNAQQNEIAIAYPIENISIDGDLSDWGKGITKFPINSSIWQSSDVKTKDYTGYFSTAYSINNNSLYIAIVTKDTSHIVKKEEIEVGDLIALFLDEKHDEKGSGILRYKISQQDKSITNPRELWDFSLKKELNWDRINYKIGHSNNETVYEIAIKLRTPIYEGRVIGYGNLVQDVDSDNETVYAWVGRGDKDFSAQPGRLGSIIFSSQNKQISELSGKVKWKNSSIDLKPEGVRIINDTGDWVYVKINGEGEFSCNLPYGNYKIIPGETALFSDNTFVKVDKAHYTSININKTKTTVLFELKTIEKPAISVIQNPLKKDDYENIDTFIQSLMDFYEVKGATFSSFDNHKIKHVGTYGVSNGYSKGKVTKETLFEVASITKTVFAYLVLRLYDKGIIDLDEKMHKKLRFEEINHSSYAELITPRLILSHQTGLPNWRDSSKIEFKFKPGTDFSYSGEAYQYLQRYLEEITGKSINELLIEEVHKPLGLKRFYYQYDDYAYKHKSHGHYNGFPSAIDLPERPWVAGCLITNASDMAKFLIALAQGKGLNPETYKLMISNHNKVPKDFKENIWGFDEHMGLGVFVEKSPDGLILRHSGNNGDFKSLYKIYTGLNKGFFIVTNGNTGDFMIAELEKVLISY